MSQEDNLNLNFSEQSKEDYEPNSNTETNTKVEPYNNVFEESVDKTCSSIEPDVMNKLFDNHCLDKSNSPVRHSSDLGNVLPSIQTGLKPPSKHWLKTYSKKKTIKLDKETCLNSANPVESRKTELINKESNDNKLCVKNSHEPVTSVVLLPWAKNATPFKVLDTKGNLVAGPPILKANSETLELLKKMLTTTSNCTSNTVISSHASPSNITINTVSSSSGDNFKRKPDVNKSVNQSSQKATNKTEIRINTDRTDMISLNSSHQVPFQQCLPSTSQQIIKSAIPTIETTEDECNNHVARLKNKAKQCDVIRVCKEWEQNLGHNIRTFQSNQDSNQLEDIQTEEMQQESKEQSVEIFRVSPNWNQNNLKTCEEITSVENKDNQNEDRKCGIQLENECQRKAEVSQDTSHKKEGNKDQNSKSNQEIKCQLQNEDSMPDLIKEEHENIENDLDKKQNPIPTNTESHEDSKNDEEIKTLEKIEEVENTHVTEKRDHNFKTLDDQDLSHSEEVSVDSMLPKTELPAKTKIGDTTKTISSKESEIKDTPKVIPTKQLKLRRTKRKSIEDIKKKKKYTYIFLCENLGVNLNLDN
uniref:Uncharacterized protein n=1 Tax=Cacopsylla melanoneura TaxID=428564 RepID=A0A8D8YF01_9HEMI